MLVMLFHASEKEVEILTHFLKEILMASLSEKVNQVLANQQTDLGNQTTILSNQAAILTAIQNIPGANIQAVTDALASIDTQIKSLATQATDIQAQVDEPVTPPAANP